MKTTIISFLLAFTFIGAFAGNGEIWGFVYDEHDFPLIKASISISDTLHPEKVISSSFTDKGGRYVIQNLKPGKYNISISYTGYETREEKGLWVGEEKALVLDVKLKKLQ